MSLVSQESLQSLVLFGLAINAATPLLRRAWSARRRRTRQLVQVVERRHNDRIDCLALQTKRRLWQVRDLSGRP